MDLAEDQHDQRDGEGGGDIGQGWGGENSCELIFVSELFLTQKELASTPEHTTTAQPHA